MPFRKCDNMAAGDTDEYSPLTSETVRATTSYGTVDKIADSLENTLTSSSESDNLVNAETGRANRDGNPERPSNINVWGVISILLLGMKKVRVDALILVVNSYDR